MTEPNATQQPKSVLGNDVNALFVRPFLDYTQQRFGAAAVDAMLARLGTNRTEITDATAWVTLEFVEAFGEEIARVHADAPDLAFEYCGRLAFTPKYVGIVGPLLGALGSPEFAYSTIRKSLPRFNKISSMRVENLTSSSATVRFHFLEKRTERTRWNCKGRAAQLAGVTTMFGLPPAKVEHPTCILDGADECVYHVTWRPARGRWASYVAFAGAAAVGCAIGVAFGLPSAALGFMGLASALAGYFVGRSFELRHEVRARNEDIIAQGDALTRSVKANEDRFAELLEAKTAVEEKVEQRTLELRATSEKLEIALDEVRALDKVKTEFFANISHDLRTPLTLLVGPLDEMRAGRVPAGGTQTAVESMYRNAHRLLTLINSLLDLAKVDAGGTKIARAPTSMSPLVSSVLSTFANAASVRGVKLELDVDPAVPVVLVDPSWLESALANLLGNALKYAPANSFVRTRVFRDEADLVIQVQDNGPGIPQEHLKRVFDRFAQAGGATERRGGTGLGLAIVREAARLHGGEATVESPPGEGAKFRIRIPMTPVDTNEGRELAPVAANNAASIAAELTQPRTSAPPRSNAPKRRISGAPRVLVVEDNDDLRAYITAVLQADHEVASASNGLDALEIVDDFAPNAVVTDWDMPQMDGIELTRELRKRKAGRAIPIILLTAFRDTTRVVTAFDAGATDYVTKPFQQKELLARLGTHLTIQRLLVEVAHRERLSLLGETAASVAHNIKNPLSALRGGLPAVRGKLAATLDKRTVEMFEMMEDCVSRIEVVTNDMLDLSRVDRADVEKWRPSLGLKAAARIVGTRTGAVTPVELDLDDSIEVDCRPGDLNHVFLNLMDNALRYASASGRVLVRSHIVDGAWQLDVEDSGPGIAPELGDRVFSLFASTRVGEGNGIGLAIAKRVTEQHGGTITAGKSSLGGAKFTMRIPLRATSLRSIAPSHSPAAE